MYEYAIVLFMMKYMTNQLPVSFNGTFPSNNDIRPDISTRQSHLLRVKCSASEFSNRFPIFKYPRIWNKWVNIVPNYTTYSFVKFKRCVKNRIIADYKQNVLCENLSCRDCFSQ